MYDSVLNLLFHILDAVTLGTTDDEAAPWRRLDPNIKVLGTRSLPPPITVTRALKAQRR